MDDTLTYDDSLEFTLPDSYRTLLTIREQRRKPKDIVPGLCFEASVGMIVAPPFVGKSLLLLDLGLALATKQPWLKWTPTEQVRSIIYALDSPGWESQEQVDCLMAGRGIDPNHPWPFSLVTREDAKRMRVCGPDGQFLYKEAPLGPMDIMNPRWFRHIAQMAHATDARLIGLDSFSKIHARNENERVEMEPVMDQVAKLADITRAHVMMLHHTPVLDRGESVYAGRGSSVIAASADFVATIVKVSNKECRFVTLKGRGSDEDEDFNIVKERVSGTILDRAVRWQVTEAEERIPARELAWQFVHSALLGGAMDKVTLLSGCETQRFAESVDRYLTRFRDFGLVYSPLRGQYALTDKGKRHMEQAGE